MRRNFRQSSRQSPSNLNINFKKWNEDWLRCALEIVWKGYDRLVQRQKDKGETLKGKNENKITPLLVDCMQEERDFLPQQYKRLKFQPEYPEWEGSKTGNPKSYDIGFVLGDEEKVVFCLEAKPIERITEAGLKKYLEDVTAFLECYYAPFNFEGGMLGYLQTGTSDDVFTIIEASLKEKLENLHSPKRPHRISKHKRKVDNPAYPINFTCHHLILEMF